ncbi:YbdK family carboxylate-amine ligase [Streptomyces sp. SPB4]|uniref:carboxylate-amine ligase n=1 Tax=Streptomyces sp. SPB4 TaxID=2940553 RepID=UPI0024738324|nr:YbdK family carboxylate-amine ligase [Streptomyces sp. SPB4]MDH6544056.1 carboxylate-amine ligase [Streptomyces sp. SPB4]
MTMGVEEEFFPVDRRTGTPMDRGPRVVKAAGRVLGEQAQTEFYEAQVEVCTRPTPNLAVLRSELALLRRVMAEAAAGEGCLLVATGMPAIPPGRPPAVTPGERYERMAHRWSSLVGGYDGMVCGCHIHVGVTGHAQALALANHMRPWLPTLQAIAANSPFSLGRDTGWASHRPVEWSRWPGVGPAPVLDSSGYERLADHLVRTGTLLDRGMIYWHARPSEHVPTLEIRVCDVNADLDVVVLLTALVRGLATSLLPDIGSGRPPPDVPDRRLHVAHALAAHRGLTDMSDEHLGRGQVPAMLTAQMPLERAVPGLAAAGDLDIASELLDRLRHSGGGAERQRAARQRRGRLTDVVRDLARHTAAA